MKKKTKVNSVADNLYFLKILWKINPKRVILTFLGQFFEFGEWVFYTVVFMKYLFGAAEFQRSFEEAAAFVVISALVIMCTFGFNIWIFHIFTSCVFAI